MRRNRRLLLMDRTVPFLAALVGLVALAGAVVVQLTADARNAQLAEELAGLRASLDGLAQHSPAVPADPTDIAEALLALQQRIERLEAQWVAQPQSTIDTPAPTAPQAGADPAGGPLEDCIPVGTRFMAAVGDEMPICQTAFSVRVSAVTDDNVVVDGIGVISETGFRPIPDTTCTVTVLAADGEGFAELRVGCL